MTFTTCNIYKESRRFRVSEKKMNPKLLRLFPVRKNKLKVDFATF